MTATEPRDDTVAGRTTDHTGPRVTVPDLPRAALTHRQVVLVFIGLMLGLFLAALDQMIVSVAIRTIADDLHGLDIQAWVTTAYLITSTITTPLYGKLSDITDASRSSSPRS